MPILIELKANVALYKNNGTVERIDVPYLCTDINRFEVHWRFKKRKMQGIMGNLNYFLFSLLVI
jgi:hypothetical protein